MPHSLNFSPLFKYKDGKTLRDLGCHSCVNVDYFFVGYDTVSIGNIITVLIYQRTWRRMREYVILQ